MTTTTNTGIHHSESICTSYVALCTELGPLLVPSFSQPLLRFEATLTLQPDKTERETVNELCQVIKNETGHEFVCMRNEQDGDEFECECVQNNSVTRCNGLMIIRFFYSRAGDMMLKISLEHHYYRFTSRPKRKLPIPLPAPRKLLSIKRPITQHSSSEEEPQQQASSSSSDEDSDSSDPNSSGDEDQPVQVQAPVETLRTCAKCRTQSIPSDSKFINCQSCRAIHATHQRERRKAMEKSKSGGRQTNKPNYVVHDEGEDSADVDYDPDNLEPTPLDAPGGRDPCSRCYRRIPENPNMRCCERCRDYKKRYKKGKMRGPTTREVEEQGKMCSRCNKSVPEDKGKSTCRKCRNYMKERSSRKKEDGLRGGVGVGAGAGGDEPQQERHGQIKPCSRCNQRIPEDPTHRRCNRCMEYMQEYVKKNGSGGGTPKRKIVSRSHVLPPPPPPPTPDEEEEDEEISDKEKVKCSSQSCRHLLPQGYTFKMCEKCRSYSKEYQRRRALEGKNSRRGGGQRESSRKGEQGEQGEEEDEEEGNDSDLTSLSDLSPVGERRYHTPHEQGDSPTPTPTPPPPTAITMTSPPPPLTTPLLPLSTLHQMMMAMIGNAGGRSESIKMEVDREQGNDDSVGSRQYVDLPPPPPTPPKEPQVKHEEGLEGDIHVVVPKKRAMSTMMMDANLGDVVEVEVENKKRRRISQEGKEEASFYVPPPPPSTAPITTSSSSSLASLDLRTSSAPPPLPSFFSSTGTAGSSSRISSEPFDRPTIDTAITNELSLKRQCYMCKKHVVEYGSRWGACIQCRGK